MQERERERERWRGGGGEREGADSILIETRLGFIFLEIAFMRFSLHFHRDNSIRRSIDNLNRRASRSLRK